MTMFSDGALLHPEDLHAWSLCPRRGYESFFMAGSEAARHVSSVVGIKAHEAWVNGSAEPVACSQSILFDKVTPTHAIIQTQANTIATAVGETLAAEGYTVEEKSVTVETGNYRAKVDAVLREQATGMVVLADIRTGRRRNWSWLQLGAAAMAYEKNHGLPKGAVGMVMFIHAPRTSLLERQPIELVQRDAAGCQHAAKLFMMQVDQWLEEVTPATVHPTPSEEACRGCRLTVEDCAVKHSKGEN